MLIRPARPEDLGGRLRPDRPLGRTAAALLHEDRGGCWVADDDGDVSGVVLSYRYDHLWVLAALEVWTPQDRPVLLRTLLERALEHSQGALRGIGRLGADPDVVAAVRGAGFDLHPTMAIEGLVDRSALPVVDHVRAHPAGDRVDVDSVDRQVRGGSRGPVGTLLAERGSLLVCDTGSATGYLYLDADGPVTLAATSREAARRLLWAGLTLVPADRPVRVGGLSAAQDWALDVGLAAGLTVRPDAFLALRHHRVPAPFLPAPMLG